MAVGLTQLSASAYSLKTTTSYASRKAAPAGVLQKVGLAASPPIDESEVTELSRGSTSAATSSSQQSSSARPLTAR